MAGTSRASTSSSSTTPAEPTAPPFDTVPVPPNEPDVDRVAMVSLDATGKPAQTPGYEMTHDGPERPVGEAEAREIR